MEGRHQTTLAPTWLADEVSEGNERYVAMSPAVTEIVIESVVF